ncbi:MAG: type II toxin-antitoxin system PrlF family antitoxin [Burkholderiaceae bacterium]|nr:type II toxin-antitoxin system PrlF family antitoxin [Burkholderiaceae bacterium]
MSEVREVATLTSKGQITLPKPIRQALGISVGGKVAFALREGEVVVSRAEEPGEHADPAIEAFLGLIEKDIRAGKRVRTLPEALARSMLARARRRVDLEEPIEGEVAL